MSQSVYLEIEASATKNLLWGLITAYDCATEKNLKLSQNKTILFS